LAAIGVLIALIDERANLSSGRSATALATAMSRVIAPRRCASRPRNS
jgi:hypothetical protein